MKSLPLLLATVVSLGACATWTHAPGHGVAAMPAREVFRTKMPQMCGAGTCTMQGPGGEVRFSEVSAIGNGRARTSTTFDIDYLTWKGLCRGPYEGTDGRGPRPLACTLTERGTDKSALLVVDDGCTSAHLQYSPTRSLELRTDTVEILGHTAPAREVSLLERGAVVVYSTRSAVDIAFHHAWTGALPAEQTVALLAMHTYAEMGGTPPECLVATR